MSNLDKREASFCDMTSPDLTTTVSFVTAILP
jgi:hypothetical protein